MKSKFGFSLPEITIILAFLALVAIFVTVNVLDYSAFARDNTRKSDINAIYYALENVYFKSHNYYPETISPDILTVVDPSAFTDPSGLTLGSIGSQYFYEPGNCHQGQCQEFKLWAHLEKEPTYLKTHLTKVAD